MASASFDHCDFGDDLDSSWGQGAVARLVVGLFGFMLVGTGLLDLVFPAKGIQAVGAEADIAESARRGAKFGDGSLARLFESDLREHSRARKLLTPAYSYFKFAYLDEAPAGNTVGREHWLFKTNRIRLTELDESRASQAAVNAFVALDRRFRGNQIELCIIPIPRKSYVARDFLPRDVDGQQAIDDLVIGQLLERDVLAVDLRGVFAEHEPLELYFKLDTHWTPLAARITAEEVARTVGDLKAAQERLGELTLVPMPAGTGSSVALLHSFGINAHKRDLGRLGLRAPMLSSYSFGPADAWFAQSAPNTAVALSGTSFSDEQALGKALSHYTGAPVYNHSEPGLLFMETMAQLLETYANTPGAKALKRIYFETPIASIIIPFTERGAHFPRPMQRIFDLVDPGRSMPLLDLPKAWMPFEIGREWALDLRPNLTVMRTGPGFLAHSGDGVMAIRLTGELIGEPLRVLIVSGTTSYSHIFQPGPFDYNMPLLSSGPTTASLRMLTSSLVDARLRIDGARLIHEPVGDKRTKLEVHTTGTGYELVPQSRAHLASRSALLIKTKSQTKKRVPFQLTLAIHTKGRAARQVSFSGFQAGGWIAVDLGYEHGLELSKVEIIVESHQLAIDSAVITGTK